MEESIAVVTGSSSGFGLAIALELAKDGYFVLAAMRQTEKGGLLLEAAGDLGVAERIQCVALDVTSSAAIAELRKLLNQKGRVDLLVNNAGYAAAGFVEEIPLDEYRRQFETNVLGVIGVTQALLPLFRKQRRGMIVTIGSISGKIGFPGLSPYVASKHALEGWSESLRLEMIPFGVKVVLVEPGSYQTGIWSTGTRMLPQAADSPYRSYRRRLEDNLKQQAPRYGDPREVAEKVVRIARLANPGLRYPIGRGVRLAMGFKTAIGWHWWERLVKMKLKLDVEEGKE